LLLYKIIFPKIRWSFVPTTTSYPKQKNHNPINFFEIENKNKNCYWWSYEYL